MTRLVVSPELPVWLAERMAAWSTESPAPLRWLACFVAEFGALPL
jgi:hypothetical protein